MSVLPRAHGSASAPAVELVQQLHTFAIQPAADDVDVNLQRIRDLRHLYAAAEDAFAMGMAVVNEPGPGKVSYRRVEDEIGWDKLAVQRWVQSGKAALERMPKPEPPPPLGDVVVGVSQVG